MKRILSKIALGCMITAGLTACTDWLDVNTDPDNPNNKSLLVSNRLPWIQRMYMYSAGMTNFRTAATAGWLYSNSWSVNTCTTTWNFANGLNTGPYQTWFVESASNLNDLYEKAKEDGAYHYMAAADVYYALGFMEMLDLYGEIPFTDALSSSPVPKYDDGKTIYNGIMAKLDEAIELFGKTQSATATPLANGDVLNGGDVSKWLKMCYGLKARYMLKLSKKSDLFKPDEILQCLSHGPQSVDDNSVLPCYNAIGDVTDYLYGDPVQTNGNWDYAGYGSNQRVSSYLYNLLTNMRGAGIEDPRFTKIVPAIMSNVKLSGGTMSSFTWKRSKPVDSHYNAERLLAGGAASIAAPTYAATDVTKDYTITDAAKRAQFVAAMTPLHAVTVSGDKVSVTYKAGSVYVNSGNYILAGDTAYVNMRSCSTLTGQTGQKDDAKNLYWYASGEAYKAGVIFSTGSFQLRPVSDFEMMTFHEACFIKAEVLFRKGDKAGALAAYKAGIKANLDFMQRKLTTWQGQGYDNPDMMPMNTADITNYLASAAVCQNAADLTMRDIMLQKYVAMGLSLENWNDMRRFNYSAGNIGSFGVVYPDFDRSPMFTGQEKLTGTSKNDVRYWPRRWRLPGTLELSYNETNAKAINPHCEDVNIWSMPVWWDCETDAEYEGYLK